MSDLYMCVYLTQWGLNKMADILQTTFSNAFSWKKISVFWFKFLWSSFQGLLTISQCWFSKWMLPVKCQAITWTNVDPVYRCIYGSLGFTCVNPLIPTCQAFIAVIYDETTIWHTAKWVIQLLAQYELALKTKTAKTNMQWLYKCNWISCIWLIVFFCWFLCFVLL